MTSRWWARIARRAHGGRRVLGVAAALSALSMAPSASAQAAAAEALFDQGRAAMEKNDFETACKRFRESDRLDPAPGTRLNLADCEEKRGRLATAWELFRSAIGDLPESDERRAVAQERVSALEPRVPRLVIRLAKRAPAGTRVTFAGATFSEGSFGVPLPVDPGEHELIVTAAGHRESRLKIRLKEGDRKTFEVAPREPAGAGPDQGAPPSGARAVRPEGAAPAPAGGDTRTLGFIVGGVGIAALAGAGVTGAMTLSAQSTNENNCFPGEGYCNQEGKDAASSGATFGALTTGLLVAGIAGVGLGGYFVFTSGDGRELAAVAPRVDRAGGSLSLVRRW
ncbi:MAG: hypothetical protein IT376_21400 [Polyangiaceae bacterium]|nr:hypothetical protein [Polyangiaceae bacterium]